MHPSSHSIFLFKIKCCVDRLRPPVKTGSDPLAGQREALASFATLTEPLKKT